MQIELNDLEWACCLKRFEMNKDNQFSRRAEPAKGDDNLLEGYAGELAFCKYVNVLWSMTIGVDLYDCEVPGLGRVDVKTNDTEGGDLMVSSTHHEVDAYALMIGQNRVYTFKGWLPKDRICRPENWCQWMPLPCWKVPQTALWGLKQ